jgi:hypothetical protein
VPPLPLPFPILLSGAGLRDPANPASTDQSGERMR